MTGTKWLICCEMTAGRRQYLFIHGYYTGEGGGGGGKFEWCDNAAHAMRFVSHQQASMFLGAIRTLSDGLPHRETVPGLRSSDPLPIVVQEADDAA